MKKLFVSFAVLSLLVSCGGSKQNAEVDGGPSEPECPAGAVDLGIVLPRLDKDGNPMKDAAGNEITYKVFWAKSNLSEMGLCAKETDFGDYYAWGEVLPYYAYGHAGDNPCEAWRNGKTEYDWSAYQWALKTAYKLTRYCTNAGYWGGIGDIDGKTEFSDYDYADDAARYALHGKWRTPSDAEWAALKEQCTWEWKTTDDGYAHTGYLVKAENGKSIFLPSAGFRSGNTVSWPELYGYYWSSTLNAKNTIQAKYLYFYAEDNVNRSAYFRCHGYSVRPVSE